MNALTDAGVLRRGQAVLDARHAHPAVARSRTGAGCCCRDTVGFIRDLPHHLVASFKATLEEARQARLLLHVVDASSPEAEEQIKAVNAVLEELGCDDEADAAGAEQGRPRRRPVAPGRAAAHHPKAVAVSAATGQGLDDLRDAVIEALSADFADAEVTTSAPATARCWRTWRPTRRSTGRSTTTTTS